LKIAISNVVTDLDLSSISRDGVKVQVLRIPISNVVTDLDLSSIGCDGINVQVLRIPISNVVMDGGNGMKEIATFSQFHLWMTKQVIN